VDEIKKPENLENNENLGKIKNLENNKNLGNKFSQLHIQIVTENISGGKLKIFILYICLKYKNQENL
jgi:hypothetical protein